MARTLVLAGTTDARLLGRKLSESGIDALLSFAGRTRALADPGVPYRVGGFGGVDGLIAYLKRESIDSIVDATHPFAAQMSDHAVLGSRHTGVPLLRLERPPWAPERDDRWFDADDMPHAAQLLGPTSKRVFLAVGRLEVDAFVEGPQHRYIMRAVDPFEPPPALKDARVIAARGPFVLSDELALFRREEIEFVVSKNSGAQATYAKVLAARELGIPVIMVRRPRTLAARSVRTIGEALDWTLRLKGRLLPGLQAPAKGQG